MFLDAATGPNGGPITLSYFNGYLLEVGKAMYGRGWTVIGSRFKTPNLHPWKLPSREDLFYWMQQNLMACRANSLNLRLADTKTIALDCDFNDAKLMDSFVAEMQRYLGLPKNALYTCAGKKGGKLFFTFMSTNVADKPPRSLGPVVYTKGHAGDSSFKQELEVKSDLSTFAGLYGLNADKRMIIYGPYKDLPYIATASPKQLPVLTTADLQSLSQIYKRLVSKGDYVNEFGAPQLDATDRELTRAAVVYYYTCMWQELTTKHNEQKQAAPTSDQLTEFVRNNQLYWRYFKPFFSSIALEGANELIEYMFCRSGKSLSFERLIDVDILLGKCSIETLEAQQNLLRLSSFFLRGTRAITDRFYALAAQYGCSTSQRPEVMLFDIRKAKDKALPQDTLTAQEQAEIEWLAAQQALAQNPNTPLN